MEKREFIINLIEQDIKHNQLLNGLYEIGLTDNERYTLGIVWLVADMVEQEEGEVPDSWLELYHSVMLNIDKHLDPNKFNFVAEKLYDKLIKLQ
ncbi:MAG: hypothetical protein GQ574_08440 [Crocinitomix sp.]|nr:hypothetical protein [Crocinitomix sp.]